MNRRTTPGTYLNLISLGPNHRYFHSVILEWGSGVLSVPEIIVSLCSRHTVSNTAREELHSPARLLHCTPPPNLHPIALWPEPCSPQCLDSSFSSPWLRSQFTHTASFSWMDQAVIPSLLCVRLIPIHASAFIPAVSLTRLRASWGSQPCLCRVCAQDRPTSHKAQLPQGWLLHEKRKERKKERREGGRKKGRRTILLWGIRKSFF